jgi:RNA polymerase sigma-70 factor (ECF subfamily)
MSRSRESVHATSSFKEALLTHLDAAYNLARWLSRNQHDAEDIVQEAMMKAIQYQSSYSGGDLRAWLLTIVRNTAYSLFQRQGKNKREIEYDETTSELALDKPDPETALWSSIDCENLREALASLPEEYREALVLRELEGYSYKEISEITGSPIGTIMSRLNRARAMLHAALVLRRR